MFFFVFVFFLWNFFATVLNKVFIRDSQCFILFYHVYRYITYNTYFKHLTVLSTWTPSVFAFFFIIYIYCCNLFSNADCYYYHYFAFNVSEQWSWTVFTINGIEYFYAYSNFYINRLIFNKVYTIW